MARDFEKKSLTRYRILQLRVTYVGAMWIINKSKQNKLELRDRKILGMIKE